MQAQREIFQRPRFRPGVNVSLGDDEASLEYRRQGCAVTYPEDGREELQTLLRRLSAGGSTLEDLRALAPRLCDELPSMLEEFDRLGLLTETAFPAPVSVITGAQLYREIFRLTERLKGRLAKSGFYAAMVDGTATRRQLIGYVLEYYHVVSLAPGLIAPALASAESRKTRDALQAFLGSELHHDRMIEASLRAVGIGLDTLDFLQPLPTTFAICASLGVFAKQHPLSFKANLFLFEQTDERFNEAFCAHCRVLELPEGFIEPILRHAGINDAAHHDVVSAKLLAEVPCVSAEEQTIVKKNTAILLESLLQQENEILSYYGNDCTRVPRVFD